ncbi:PREDICTED: subtilisin-like protease SBT4.3 [Prunus mume]|uniref:Subtilisin-like protease SBT4.3 n=1 Tax=Prunus mume TaxID=102107 RepID=A0ABM1LUH7_PRUMU|nr:PREDICTED: subtilisin-like protease SBT4.3 [Prunus mume]
MAKAMLHFLPYALLLAAFVLACHGQERKVHIVYMGERPKGDFSVASTHHSMLETVLGSTSSAKDSLIYSYGKSFNGFAARLSDEEVAKLSEMEGVVSVLPNHKLKLHTTRSWDFMGFSKGTLPAPIEGKVIIGVLDTGIWPESDSFNDDDFGPPPSKWKGKCTGANFTCNNKLIGARYYNSEDYYDSTDIKSPRDSEGHGSHTASTAAGREVPASYFGLAAGTARGGVPNARIAVYKVCWATGCASADILAAFDDAIADGVDIISTSLGAPFPLEYLEDPIAIGSFHAMKYGILTSSSAGNSGPFPATVSNYAPWILTVAASTIDRRFVAKAVLGNGEIYSGLSVNNFDLNGKSYPLIWGGDAANFSAGANSVISSQCFHGAMNSYKVKGKIVFCERIGDGAGILSADGVGAIMADSLFTDFAFSFPLSATVITTEDGQRVLDYIRSTENPVATILVGETDKDVMAPYIVSFSSRGPNPITPDILKPDLTAPGVDILAAWSPVAPPSIDFEDTRSVEYNIISGTSMSCPHASGAAAYVKAAHPKWSAAAIKSALMTTAHVLDPKKNDELEFAYGSGHINPLKAVKPGLVFDASEADYVHFLCKQGYNTTTLKLITGQKIDAVFTRTVTNVGSPNSTYYINAYTPYSRVSVTPSTLSFSAVGEKKSFTVKVSGPPISQQPIVSGTVILTDGVHVVRSPFVIYTILPGAAYPSNSILEKRPSFRGSSLYHGNGILGRN